MLSSFRVMFFPISWFILLNPGMVRLSSLALVLTIMQDLFRGAVRNIYVEEFHRDGVHESALSSFRGAIPLDHVWDDGLKRSSTGHQLPRGIKKTKYPFCFHIHTGKVEISKPRWKSIRDTTWELMSPSIDLFTSS